MSNFHMNVVKLVSGSVIAQVFSFLLIPIIARIYGPENFGILQLFTSISGIIAVISCFSYQFSIMLPKKEEDSANIFVLCVALTAITSVICGFMSILFGDHIGRVLNTPQISNYLILLPIIVFLNGIFFVMNYWLSRRLKFGIISVSNVSNSAISKLAQIYSSFVIISPAGLISGLIGGYVIANLVMLREMKKDQFLFRHISIQRMRELAIRYKEFPLYSSWSIVANAISIQVPSFMLAFFYSTTIVGYYSLANMAVNLPMGLMGSAIGQVFFQKASEQKNQSGIVKDIVSDTHKKLISIGIFPMILLMILSEKIFGLIFGAEWSISGIYVKILVPWLFLVFISSPLSTLFSVLEKQEVGLFFNLTLLISRIFALYIGGYYGGPVFAMTLFSATGIVFWGWMNMYLLKISNVELKESFYVLIKYLLMAFIVSLPVILTNYLELPISILLTVTGISTTFYYLIIIYEDANLRNELFNFMRG